MQHIAHAGELGDAIVDVLIARLNAGVIAEARLALEEQSPLVVELLVVGNGEVRARILIAPHDALVVEVRIARECGRCVDGGSLGVHTRRVAS